jgi:hypothetical protein
VAAYIGRVLVDVCVALFGSSLLPNSATYTYQQGHDQYTGVGKSRLTVACMEKDMQVMIITIASLTQKSMTMAQCT